MKNFEQNLRRLDEIIAEIEAGARLEASLELYKEGMALAAELAGGLNDFEKEVLILRDGLTSYGDFGGATDGISSEFGGEN
jgi:exodeoxyribonuclease VII small subunit